MKQHNLSIVRTASDGQNPLSTRHVICSCGWQGTIVPDNNDLQAKIITEELKSHLSHVNPEDNGLNDKIKIASLHLQYSFDRDLSDINQFLEHIRISRKFCLPMIHLMSGQDDSTQMRNCAMYLLMVSGTISDDDICEPLTIDNWFPMGQLYDDSRILLGTVLNNNHQFL